MKCTAAAATVGEKFQVSATIIRNIGFETVAARKRQEAVAKTERNRHTQPSKVSVQNYYANSQCVKRAQGFQRKRTG